MEIDDLLSKGVDYVSYFDGKYYLSSNELETVVAVYDEKLNYVEALYFTQYMIILNKNNVKILYDSDTKIKNKKEFLEIIKRS